MLFSAKHGRGEIRDNAMKALVTSKVFQTRVVKAKKGKGSYQRKGRNSKDYALVVSGRQLCISNSLELQRANAKASCFA
ncbi:ribosome alternative rescue factor ArfA [Alkalimonas sp. NCh-2]|uniref:ribosome alternative rescue factor ArfA n=1 Tax=Alkalimonas sp. NCh-2 TaxID=3144846 RepID=UPI0031F6D16E